MARILLAAVAALLLGAPAATATIVVQRDIDSSTDEIWAYDDAGGNGRLLVPEAFEKGQYNMYEPSTTATGSDVVFTGRTPNTATYGNASSPPGACGRWCYGIYVLSGGAIRRISPPVDPCDGFPCVIFEGSPEIAPGGSVVFDRFTKLWSACGASWCTQDGDEVLAERPMTGGDEEATVLATPECPDVESPAPHPTTVGLVLFEGCTGTIEGQEWKPIYHVSTIDAQGAVTHLFYDDFPVNDPAWNADGTMIVTAEGGTNSGIWISTADGTGSQYVLAIHEDDHVRSPRFAGDEVVFVHKGDVYSIDPAGCEEPCSIDQATKVTTSGDVASVGYTTASPQPFVKPVPTGDGDGGGTFIPPKPTPTPAPSPGPAPTPAPGPVVDPPALGSGFAWTGKRSLRGLLSGRLAFELPCDCRTTGVLRLGRTVVARGAGQNGATLKPTRAARRKLRRAKRVRLKLTVTAGGKRFTRSVTLTR